MTQTFIHFFTSILYKIYFCFNIHQNDINYMYYQCWIPEIRDESIEKHIQYPNILFPPTGQKPIIHSNVVLVFSNTKPMVSFLYTFSLASNQHWLVCTLLYHKQLNSFSSMFKQHNWHLDNIQKSTVRSVFKVRHQSNVKWLASAWE